MDGWRNGWRQGGRDGQEERREKNLNRNTERGSSSVLFFGKEKTTHHTSASATSKTLHLDQITVVLLTSFTIDCELLSSLAKKGECVRLVCVCLCVCVCVCACLADKKH